jgi:glycosyltransferase involved in cell wall biosynthesis
VPARKIVTASLGADVARFRPGAFLPLGPGEPLRAAFVGNDPVRKGLIYAADAARRLKGRVKIHVFGKARLPATLSDDRGDVLEYHGALPQSGLAKALTSCHVAVMPSLWEGFGMSVYECMAAGLPTIVSDHVPAQVAEGEGAWIVPIRDSEAIARHFERLLEDDYRADAARRATAYVTLRQWDRYHHALQDGLGLGRGQ